LKSTEKIRLLFIVLLVGVSLSGLAIATHSADLTGDGKVDQADLDVLIREWRGSGTADLNHDVTINFRDAGILLSSWGTVAPPPPPPPPPLGPLRVHPSNGRYFTDGSGKAIYLTGSHVWDNLADRGTAFPPPPFDFTAYLNLLTSHNHNFIRLWRWELSRTTNQVESSTEYWHPHPWVRSGPGNALDGRPKFNLTSFDQAYFDRLRARVIAARDRGIYVGIMVFEGWNLRTSLSQWSNHPMNAANNINGINGDSNGDGFGLEVQTLAIPAITAIHEAYVKKVIDTVNDLPNVLYEIANESQYSTALRDWQYGMINYIKSYQATKPQQHPVGMTDVIGANNSVLFASPAEWISPGLTVFSSADVYSVNPPATNGSKVELLDTDHTWNNAAGTWGTPETRADRKWAWKSFTRGYNPIYMDPIDLSQPNQIRSYAQAHASAILSARPAMGHTRTYANKMNLAVMTPQGSLASTGYALASTNNEYLVYQPGSGAFSLNLSSASGTFQVEWFNPATGATSSAGTVSGGGTRSFSPPFSGDAVLYLKR
jgi:hypothetical protein